MNTQPGIGAMLHYLSGGSDEDPAKYYGKIVEKAAIEDNHLKISFRHGPNISLYDNGQSCCENRYMTCDDDLSSIAGGVLQKIETRAAADIDGEYGDCHEKVFVEIITSKGQITVANHNEHNGYYGGFGLSISEDKNETL